jgi:hypothetical protein
MPLLTFTNPAGALKSPDVAYVDDPSFHAHALARARRRGAATQAATLLFSLIGAVAALFVPPAVVSLVLLPLVALIVMSAIVEWRTPGAATSAKPVTSWLLIGLAFMVGLPLAPFSRAMESIVSLPAGCAPIPPQDGLPPLHENYCAATTIAETAGMITWSAVMGTTAILLLAFAVMAKRSKLVGLAAIPTVIAGCVIAFDLGHLAETIF